MYHRPRPSRPSLLALGFGLLAAGPIHSQAPKAGPLTGLWKFNSELSDRLEDKLRDAMRPGAYWGVGEGGRAGGGRGGRGGGGGGGGGGGRPGGGGRRREGGTEDRGMSGMFEPVLQVLIRQDESSVVISDAGGQMVPFNTDGRKVKEPLLSGGDLETTAKWKDERLTIERKEDKRGTIKETYYIDPTSHRLILELKMSGGWLLRSLELRRVYDPAPEG